MSGVGRKPRVKATRRKLIPLGYLEASADGNRAQRRMWAKEQKARAEGRATGHGSGGDQC